jgi:hypothetical protein
VNAGPWEGPGGGGSGSDARPRRRPAGTDDDTHTDTPRTTGERADRTPCGVSDAAPRDPTENHHAFIPMLDSPAGPERPWTPRGSSTPDPRHRGAQIHSVDERFVVVEGPEARILRAEQTEALRAVLTWLADHPDPEAGTRP